MDNIVNFYDEEERGSYTPGFFQMKLSFPIDVLNLGDLSKEDLGTFAHEYMHYLQNISTPFGLWQAMTYYNVLIEFFRSIKDLEIDELPLKDEILQNINNDNIRQQVDMEKEFSGSKSCFNLYPNSEIHLKCEEVEIHSILVRRIVIYVKDSKGQNQMITLGAHVIKESMAAMFQLCIDPDSSKRHPDFPYNAVQIIANKYAPNIANDLKKLIAICFISLHSMQVGYKFMDYLLFANDKPKSSISELFGWFMEKSKVKSDIGEISIKQLGDEIGDKFKNHAKNLLFGGSDIKMKYLSEIIDRSKISEGLIPILNLIEENEIDVNLLTSATEACGRPIIWNDNGFLYIPTIADGVNNESKEDYEIMGLIVHGALYQRLTDAKWSVCPMFHLCDTQGIQTKEECYDIPWRGQTCMMTVIARSVGIH